MGYTFSEKVFEKKLGHPVQSGENVVASVDLCMASDTTAPLAIKAFQSMGGVNVANKDQVVFVIDHATPCPNERIANLHALMRDFAQKQGFMLFDQQCGVCHQVLMESGLLHEGMIVMGADSHTCSAGAIGAFAVGVGSTDLGAAMLTGKNWFRVPESVKITLTGKLPKNVCAKDVILKIIGDLGADGATYQTVEYHGDGFDSFTLDERMTVCNMTAECGAKTGVFASALKDPMLVPDADAHYVKEFNYNAQNIIPMVACPHNVDNVVPVTEVSGVKINQVFVGSCTNARLSDLAIVANALKERKLAPGVRMLVCPASAKVYLKAIELGYVNTFVEAGAVVMPSGCALCVGTLGGVPADNEAVFSTSNRNFLGRMGNNKAKVYLGSPATAAAAALTGEICDPREVL